VGDLAGCDSECPGDLESSSAGARGRRARSGLMLTRWTAHKPESPGIGLFLRISGAFQARVSGMRRRNAPGSNGYLKSDVARLQGSRGDGARRIRTADLLGAIQGLDGDSRLQQNRCFSGQNLDDRGVGTTQMRNRMYVDIRRSTSIHTRIYVDVGHESPVVPNRGGVVRFPQATLRRFDERSPRDRVKRAAAALGALPTGRVSF
jgi:hypothetical protein